MSITRVVAITGCDSGLGWAIAARSAREGLVTIAGMYQGTETTAAQALKKLCAHPYSLDVTNLESISGFREYVQSLLRNNPNYRLHAVVNNAGVMTIGNYEWQTSTMIENAININLFGAMRVASAFLPDLRKSALENTVGSLGSSYHQHGRPLRFCNNYLGGHCPPDISASISVIANAGHVPNNTSTSKPRIINVASHCGLQPLPGFAAYSASKAGVLAWTRALRLEHRTHGLAAVAFVPGGFVGSSNIISKQSAHGHAMLEHLNAEQKSFYEKNITTLTNYLQLATAHNSQYDSLKDENIIEAFVKALTDDNPKELYKVESWRYMFYYTLFKLPLPEATHGWLIKQFLNFPMSD